MSSTKRAPHTAPGTAERIRDAAISLFAAHGFTRTTVRQIAAAAEVSPGLVIHHFGSKAQLREACDDHVFEALTDIKREHATASPMLVGELLTAGPMRSYVEYLLASLLDPSAQGQRFFDHYVQVVEEMVEQGFAGYTFRPMPDRRAQSTMIAMLALAPVLLEPRIRHALGTEDLQGSMARLVPVLFDLYRDGLLDSLPEGHPGHDTAAGPAGEAGTDPAAGPGPRATPGSPHDPPGEDAPPPPAPHEGKTPS